MIFKLKLSYFHCIAIFQKSKGLTMLKTSSWALLKYLTNVNSVALHTKETQKCIQMYAFIEIRSNNILAAKEFYFQVKGYPVV